MTKQWLVGVDEVGRGPLAGPVSVGVVKVPVDLDWGLIPNVNDSKKLKEQDREVIYGLALELRRKHVIDFAVISKPATYIDRHGIVPAITSAQTQAFKRLALQPVDCFVKLDGGLKAPTEFAQETIIKGDSMEQVIGLASIVAKVTRDRYMRRIAPRFAAYDFATHKGYGTKVHRALIARHGLSAEHRVSYCKNIELL